MKNKFVDELPPPGNGKGLRQPNAEQAEQAAAMRRARNEWLSLGEKETRDAANALAMAIKKGRYRSFQPAGKFEAVVRGTEVFARYVGR